MFQLLRIAVSMLCLAACVVVVSFWMRSRNLQEAVYGAVFPSRALVVASDRGTLRSYTIRTTRLTRNPLYGTVSLCHYCCHDGAECAVLCDDPARRVEIAMPHWAAMLFPATFAAAPWLRWRFSLRTLLVGTTIIAAVLGAIAASQS